MKVMVFGTFDILHDGHRSLFNQALEYGDELIVVVARDETVTKLKGKPHHDETERLSRIEELGFHALLGNIRDKYRIIEDIRPDVICLGYDQTFFVEELQSELRKRNLASKIIRLFPYKPHKYKSSMLRK